MEYDPNPLLSLSRRKRRTSSNTNERRQPEKAPCEEDKEPVAPAEVKQEETTTSSSSDDVHKERKRLKKKKKEKKKRKHQCEGENCTHKRHKKHKKHKKHHHDKENTSSSSVDSSGDSGYPQVYTPEEACDNLQENASVASGGTLEGIREEIAEEDDNTVDTTVDDEEKTEDDDDDADYVPHPDEVTMQDILDIPQTKKIRNRQASCESSKSVMSAFLTEKHLWSWSGKKTKSSRAGGKGRISKYFYSAIQRGKEKISLKDTAVFCSTSKPERPFIGQITSLYEKSGGNKYVKVKWYYHPEETDVNPSLSYPGGVFESQHFDENDVQTISHKCNVVSLAEYLELIRENPQLGRESSLYYLAGRYEAREKTLTIFPDVPVNDS